MCSSEWKKCTIGNICKVRRGSSPRPIKDYLSRKGMPWVKIADATSEKSRFINKTGQCIRFSGVHKSVVVEPGTLLVSNSGTPGIPKFMGIKACVHDGWLILSDINGAISEYLYYYIVSIRRSLLHNAYDSIMKNLTIDMIRSCEINLPPLPEQKAIAKILLSLDEKIEINNKITKNLEEMAQAIFKRWFVDYEFPDEDGKPYKSSGGEMVQSELGLIPKGWVAGCLGDYAKVKSGYAFKSSWWCEKGIPVIKIKNIQNNTINLNDVSYVKSKRYKIAKDFSVNGGDLLIAMTGATIGKIGLVPSFRSLILVNQRVGKFFLGDNPVDRVPFLYCLLMQKPVYSMIVSKGSGSAQPNISPTGIEEIRTVKAPNFLTELFNKKNQKSFIQIVQNLRENQVLAQIRDALLPKLMSGEIRVPLDGKEESGEDTD